MLVNYERDAFRRGAIDRNRAFMTAVDAEVRGHVLTLTALAASKRLEVDDLPAFREEAQRVVKSQPDWQSVNLTLPSGQQVLNTNRPLGSELPVVTDLESVRRAVANGQPVAGNINLGRTKNTYVVAIRIPILRNGSVAYVLTAVIEPDGFAKLIHAQHLPASWMSSLVDGTGHFIAREPPVSPGDLASPNFRAAIAQTPEGWYRGITVDGQDSFTAHNTSQYSKWSVGFAIPASEVNAASIRAAWLVGIGALFTIGLAFLFAYRAARRISGPIAEVAKAARSIGAGEEPPQNTRHSEIREVRDVAEALSEASTAVRERAQLVEREQSILIAADRAKDEFLAMLGHELRNPLSAVSNAALLLNRPELPVERRNAVQAIICRQTEQLTRLVNDLLDVGRVVAGKIRLETTMLDLSEVTQTAVAAMQATGRADAQRISIHCDESVMVQGDRARLQQVVTNLLSNAISFTPVDGAIDISVVKEAGSAVLRIADTGAGLKDADRHAIFDLFYQADKGLHRKGGLGLGLTLVKRLVEMQGGIVSAASAGLGKGSTFTVRLPLCDDRSQAAAIPRTGTAAAVLLTILVVDDSEDARDSLQMLLGIDGHRVDVAADGPAALQALSQEVPDVAFLDIGMPGMDGYELAVQIRHLYRQRVSLIAMTGYGQPEDVRRAMDAGFDAHLIKPADLDSLNALLAKIARRPKLVVNERRA